MVEPGPGDLYLARLVQKRPYRWTLYAVFLITATAALTWRVVLGRTDQILPWYGALLSLYGFGMALASRDARSRTVYAAFGLLVAVAFTRELMGGHARLIGLIEVATCLAILGCLGSLAGDAGFPGGSAVLESGTSQHDRESGGPR